jgi:heterotetrameric sarcosine oxidase gamma subunit
MRYDVTINRLGISALFDIRGRAEALVGWAGIHLPALPDAANSYTTRAGCTLALIGPDHWILRAGLEQETALAAALNPSGAPADVSIVVVSDTLTFFTITGPDAARIMAIICPLDLHSSVFSNAAITYCEVLGLKALVTRTAGGFEIAVEQSFGDFVADCLACATA